MSLDAIGIACADIPKNLEFFELLGVKLKEVGGSGHFEGTTPSGVRIMLDSFELMRKINPEWKEPKGSGIVLCFLQDSPDRVDALYARITEAGFVGVTPPWDAFWGQRYASVQDPGGHQIDLFAPLES
ncbi:MAG: glyoxalase [Candidatus Nitrohelix vancouverensis]|uniref:Glyoxalase n=1 Tax=Candidatus Nitrohelix vancouverensis TaxID=2705534 RepID=A0A7T0C3K8_9BACT|nr:MAG: glyoxalase [Candidatus Nitrohelix vancouverensis]